MRVGIGYDLHRLAEGRHLILGGVHIPSVRGLVGHSDADVLLHAVCDALLGAAGEDDIGKHFPDDDLSYKDACSVELLKEVDGLIREKGFRISNIDAVVIAEEPRIEPFKERMRENIAGALGLEKSQVNIKATTAEGTGSVGRGEAIASQAVVLLEKSSS